MNQTNLDEESKDWEDFTNSLLQNHQKQNIGQFKNLKVEKNALSPLNVIKTFNTGGYKSRMNTGITTGFR